MTDPSRHESKSIAFGSPTGIEAMTSGVCYVICDLLHRTEKALSLREQTEKTWHEACGRLRRVIRHMANKVSLQRFWKFVK